jgi:phage terminase large subunit
LSTTSLETKQIKFSDLISPGFYDLFWDLQDSLHTHYFLKGGRGSTKSSFVSLYIVAEIMRDPDANAIIYRTFGSTLHDSVYEQINWAINELEVSEHWKVNLNPLRLTYLPTGQKILFKGLDDPKKQKSTKLPKGYFKFIWFEEADQFSGMEAIRSVIQTLMRSEFHSFVFYTYNPPKSIQSWINTEVTYTRDDRFIHHSTYLQVPRHWLGEQFIAEAEHLKATKEDAYNHEYLGAVTGTGGEIFSNVSIRLISDEVIKRWDKNYQGLDFGWTPDPLAWGRMYYDKTRKKLYIYDEIYKLTMSNGKLYETLKNKGYHRDMTTADSEEPRSINELQELGMRIQKARKGPGSVDHGIKWLASLDAIIIDDQRCPNAAREFLTYELEPDGKGGFKSQYPDKNNHTIDMTRYAMESEMTGRGVKVVDQKKVGIR